MLADWKEKPISPDGISVFSTDESNTYAIFNPKDNQTRGLQLTLPGIAGLHEATIKELKALLSWEGLRHWTALLKLFSVEGGRQGTVRWTMTDHLDALGFSKRYKADPENLARIARLVELFTLLELVVYDKSGKERSRRPLIHAEEKREKLEGTLWRLDGMDFRINPALYSGVRDPETGELGKNFYPAPVELARIDHTHHPHAYSYGLLLPIRWQLAYKKDGRDYLPLKGQTLLELGGIRYNKTRASQTWEKAKQNLEELQKIDLLGRIEWEGEPWTLQTVCRLYPADWILDRVTRGVKPEETYPVRLPITGRELKSWRDEKGWTQKETAQQLQIGVATVKRAELNPDDLLGPAIRKAFEKWHD